MKITYIAWKKVICSDVNRLIYGTQGEGLHNKGDQAIQNFNTLNRNPGLWEGFTDGAEIPRKKEVERENRANGTDLPETFDIPLANSVNPLRLWEDRNETRKNPVKINHEIWDRKQNHAQAIIEPWYLGYMRILEEILCRAKEKFPQDPNVEQMLDYVSARLARTAEIRGNLLQWIYETQDGFCAMTLDTSFMRNDRIGDLVDFVENNFYVVVKCEENGAEKNMALMANRTAEALHPAIRALLQANEKGGAAVDIDAALVPSSPAAQQFLTALERSHNMILYGPPGTGKTHLLRELVQAFSANVLFDDLDTKAPFRVVSRDETACSAWCTFHPSYSYETFVYGVKPVVVEGQLAFQPHIGPFLRQSLAAMEGKRALLVIDEINRGRADAIFGNMLPVLNHETGATVRFTHPITVEGRKVSGLSTSENLFVVGTMNALDKSTSPLSGELKRKFEIVEVLPSVEVLRAHLQRNSSVDAEMAEFCCTLMEGLNERICALCGKEFALGQGFFWPLVCAREAHLEVLADILCNKILPHLKDVLPPETLEDFFLPENEGVLYTAGAYGYDFKDLSSSGDAEIVNAFAVAVGAAYRVAEVPHFPPQTATEAEKRKLAAIRRKLLRHHNVILTGVTGTGKSYLAGRIAEDPFFVQTATMYWHGSTDYTDTIEGISAMLTPAGKPDYKVLPGMIKQLADSPVEGPKLMVIEGINKCNPAEALGELITLLEGDKRGLRIEGYEGEIRLPEDLYFLCTCDPNAENSHKLDSAMKRRFAIAELCPDAVLLALHLKVSQEEVDVEEEAPESWSSARVKRMAVQVLEQVNRAITTSVGAEHQIGHAAFWDLSAECTLSELAEQFDRAVLPLIEELCFDADVAGKIFGADSPMFRILPYGVAVRRLSSLTMAEQRAAWKGLLSHG